MILNKKRISLLMVVVMMLGVVLTACGGGNTTTAPTTGGSTTTETSDGEKTLIIGYERDAETLNHLKTGWYSDALIYMHDRLVSRDYDFAYQPGLATSWDTSEDGLTWTFHLRDDVLFHNGEKLTAKDVKWTLDMIMDPETASPTASDYASFKEVNVIDDKTVEIVLSEPFPNILFVLSNTASGIINEKAYVEAGDDYGVSTVIGTGPYMFESWTQGDEIVLKKNPDYNWGPEWLGNKGPATIDKLVLKTIPEENTRFMELLAGNIQVLRDVPPTFIERVEGNDDVKIEKVSATQLVYLAYPTDTEPFTDVKVRQAINHAINKEEIITYIYRGIGTAADGYLAPSLSEEYLAESGDLSYKFDPETSKRLLAEAGYPNGLTLKLAAENSTEYSRLAEVLQNQLSVVGINVDIQLYDSSSYTAMLRNQEQELFLRKYSWPNADILDYFLLSSQIPFPNHSRWNDAETDRLIKVAATSPTWEDRAEGYHEVQRHLIEEAVWAPIYIPERLYAVRKEVQNMKIHPWAIFYNDGVDLTQ